MSVFTTIAFYISVIICIKIILDVLLENGVRLFCINDRTDSTISSIIWPITIIVVPTILIIIYINKRLSKSYNNLIKNISRMYRND